jgi:ureidoacrylate peracid hydrolase
MSPSPRVDLANGTKRVKAEAMTAEVESAVSVEARPGTFELSVRSTAVIVVDMQHDFAAPDGMFGRAGIPVDGIQSVIEPTRRVLDAAREAGILVVYLAMQFAEDLADLGPATAPNRLRHLAMGVGQHVDAPDGTSSRVLVGDTWNTKIVDDLAPHSGDVVIAKHRYSGFFQTDLDDVLRSRGITSLIFTGCTTSVCVESTLRDAFYRDYQCLLLTDCCAEPIGRDQARTNHDASVMVIEALFGWTTESEHLITSVSRAVEAVSR